MKFFLMKIKEEEVMKVFWWKFSDESFLFESSLSPLSLWSCHTWHTPYQVERAIEIALANPVDFEYAIDKSVSEGFIMVDMKSWMYWICYWQRGEWGIYHGWYDIMNVFAFDIINIQGRIFHGRKTLCNLLDKSEVKKIPEPTAEEKFILQN